MQRFSSKYMRFGKNLQVSACLPRHSCFNLVQFLLCDNIIHQASISHRSNHANNANWKIVEKLNTHGILNLFIASSSQTSHL